MFTYQKTALDEHFPSVEQIKLAPIPLNRFRYQMKLLFMSYTAKFVPCMYLKREWRYSRFSERARRSVIAIIVCWPPAFLGSSVRYIIKAFRIVYKIDTKISKTYIISDTIFNLQRFKAPISAGILGSAGLVMVSVQLAFGDIHPREKRIVTRHVLCLQSTLVLIVLLPFLRNG